MGSYNPYLTSKMRKENCVFSGLPIHPGHGKRYVPTIVQSTRPVLAFCSSKSRKMYLRKKNPRVFRWTVTYRRANKKMTTLETLRKRVRRSKKAARPIIGADLENIRQKRAQRVEIRIAGKEAAIKELELRKAKREAQKEAEKKKSAPKVVPKGAKLPKQKMPKKAGR
eukprot:NODE_3063_length_709_cov_929.928788_g2164_i0.p1 GENE.NODE_3063_length_709_cov_929.928788_g2164_i0~~NODE_3063_length_709_cov_929.928788_g2164_i0.p1  ORF type:complete len:176 (+),score=54.94 NODE_3063_length_709_cov_929.928788_g2164_i0:26-529(+)